MTNTIFGEAPYPIRSDLDQATRKAWEYLGQPGNWWTGSERAAFVAEVRVARDCRLCGVEALSPASAMQPPDCTRVAQHDPKLAEGHLASLESHADALRGLSSTSEGFRSNVLALNTFPRSNFVAEKIHRKNNNS